LRKAFHSFKKQVTTYNQFQSGIQDHFYTMSTKLILAPIIYYKRLVDMHDQYDEEAEGENVKEGMMMMTTKMLKNLVLYL
jgi:hypothetical protein